MKKEINLFVCFALLVLIVIRIFYQNSDWIAGIQYLGLLLADFSLFNSAILITKAKKCFEVVTTFFLIGTGILVVLSLLAFTVKPKFLINPTALDIITLVTLFISLPGELYKDIFNKMK